MNEIQIFQNKEFGRIRTVIIDGETWFCGRDVCNALGYTNSRKALKDHCNPKGVTKRYTLSNGGGQMMTYINEPNLYRLIAHSKLEGAIRFENWIFEEVIPTIRRTGGYGYQKCIDCRIYELLKENYTPVMIPDCKVSVKINEKPLKNSCFQTNYRKGADKMNENTERLKPLLIDYIQEVTQKSKSKDQYVCPFCNSGTGRNHTGAFTYYPESHSYNCFSCGEYGDIFTLYAKLNHLSLTSEFPKIIDDLEKKFNLPSSQSIRADPMQKDYSQFFMQAKQQLNQTDYLTKRGISPEIQQKFHCGYVPNFMYKGNQTTPAIIIPTSKGSYMWRSTTENIKQKRGTAHILNPSALKDKYCFVVEGEIDCLSVVECGFSCIGLGSTSNVNKIFSYNPSNTVLIIAMDSDRAGIKATRQLENLCIQHKVPYITVPDDIWGTGNKDANESLIADRTQLEDKLNSLMKQALTLDKEDWLKQIQERLQGSSDWHELLARNLTNNSLKNNISNICLILENDEEYKGKIEFNELTQMCSFDRNYWTNFTDSHLKLFLEQKYDIVTSIENISHACNVIADEHRYHPIKEYLQSVQWDGVSRINSVFSDFLGATNNQYTRAVATISFVGAVARVFEAGVKFDTCTVFVGKQGTGKSKFIYKIAHNPDWFSDSITTFDGKEFYEGILGRWIIELGEGTAFQKSVKERCKQALASQQDVYRKPYGRHPEVQKRQCVFFGTTNNYDFLKDETGDRRYYPIDVNIAKATKSIDKDLTDDYIAQLWAEALYLYRNGQSIYIQDNQILALAEQEQRKHFDESPLQSDIYNFLEIPITTSWYTATLDSRKHYIREYQNGNTSAGAYKRDRISVKEIACELYGYELNQPIERKMSLEISRTLTSLGWQNTGKREYLNVYGRQRMFYR
ncbi:MAG: toprim domain-containing protein [Ruminococcus sp.]|nr:toprim domain-containing protein [Ruminococcus sp.]